VNRTYDCALTDKEKAEFFNKNLNFITHKTDGSGPVEIMEAAQYCQYADVGLVFDPHVRTATVSKIYFYMSCGLPILVYGGCSNENHVLEAQAGILAPENSSITESIHLILKDRNTYKQSIKEKVFDKWGYDQIVLKWLSAIKGCIDKNLEQELQYWKWEAKKLSNLNSELSGRDAFDKPFDSFVESLIESPVGSHVKILDVGCGPISPLGLISNKYKIEVVGIDPLAKEYNDLLDERSIGAGSPLRPRYGSAENLREIFPDGTFDIAVAFNSLDHSFDPVAGINQTIQVLKPNGLLYVWCYQNEGKYENYRGLHQWNLDIQEGHLVLGKQGTNYKRIADSLEGGVITVQWFTMDGKPKVHFIIRRAA
jgi:SAM-dependent methyltransferase